MIAYYVLGIFHWKVKTEYFMQANIYKNTCT